jgi:uncharacterized coiled-coil DUF342 family protein
MRPRYIGFASAIVLAILLGAGLLAMRSTATAEQREELNRLRQERDRLIDEHNKVVAEFQKASAEWEKASAECRELGADELHVFSAGWKAPDGTWKKKEPAGWKERVDKARERRESAHAEVVAADHRAASLRSQIEAMKVKILAIQ